MTYYSSYTSILLKNKNKFAVCSLQSAIIFLCQLPTAYCQLFIFLCLFCQLPTAYCQLSVVDSLSLRLKKTLHDTDRVNTLNLLAIALYYTNPDSTILLAKQAAALAEKLVLSAGEGTELMSVAKKGKANAYGTAGAGYWVKGDYPKALENLFTALKIDEELNNKEGIAKRLGNIGNVYLRQADYPKALDYYFRALKLGEELGNKKGIAAGLGNIGLVYYKQASAAKSRYGVIGSDSLYKKALVYYFRALKLAEELGNKNHIAAWLGSIGIVYKEQASAAKSRYGVIGSDSLYKKALVYYFRALKLAEELGNKNYIAVCLGNIGSLYTKTGKFKEAEEHLLQSIAIDSAIGAQNELRQFEESLSHLYDTTAQLAMGNGQFAKAAGKFRRAMLHYKKAMVLKDTIFSEENKKQLIRKEMNYEFEKKEAAAKAESDKQAAVAAAESKRQSLVIKSLVIGALLVLAFAGFIYRALHITRKQKKVIELQKAKVEEQKRIVEEKQKEILDSIRYAKRIQDALLPRESYIDKTLKRLMKKN